MKKKTVENISFYVLSNSVQTQRRRREKICSPFFLSFHKMNEEKFVKLKNRTLYLADAKFVCFLFAITAFTGPTIIRALWRGTART